MPRIISVVLWRTDIGSLDRLVAKLKQGELRRQAASWLGTCVNRPITAPQLRLALGEEPARQVATQLRVPVDDAVRLLCGILPCAVDRASASGSLSPRTYS